MSLTLSLWSVLSGHVRFPLQDRIRYGMIRVTGCSAPHNKTRDSSMKQQPTGYVIYRGPSMLDGAPIVAIALTASTNRKTGNMVQTYILREDVRPTEALRTGADASICGNCKHRPILGGACYVVVAQGPTVVWKTFKAGKYPTAVEFYIHNLGAGRMVRLGTYGDPAAVPAYVWEALVSRASGRTGYSHQWANEALPAEHRARIARLTMASVDTPDEAHQARGLGLRYFRIRLASEPMGAREFACPASEEQGKRKTCAQCGACNGSEKATAGSPVIIAHGAKASRYIAIRSA